MTLRTFDRRCPDDLDPRSGRHRRRRFRTHPPLSTKEKTCSNR